MTSLSSPPELAREPWWRHPSGIVSAATIATMILGFFYVREKQLWEQNAAIRTNEQRGTVAIASFRAEVDALREKLNAMERSIWELEHRMEKGEKREEKRAADPPY